MEAADLRRWIRGHEGKQKSRARGIKKRLEDILMGDDAAYADIESALEAARILPAAGWRQRLSEAGPDGAVEQFLFRIEKRSTLASHRQIAFII